MELTPFVKKYIEDNHELLETDFEQFVDSFKGIKEDFICFLSILQNTLNEYTDIDSKIKEYTGLLQKHADDLKRKYTHVAGITPLLYCTWGNEPLMSSDTLVSAKINIHLTEDSSIPNTVPSDLSYSLRTRHSGKVVLSLVDKENNSSAEFEFVQKFREDFHFTELYTKKLLPTTLNQMEDLYKEIDSKLMNVLRAFNGKLKLKRLLKNLLIA